MTVVTVILIPPPLSKIPSQPSRTVTHFLYCLSRVSISVLHGHAHSERESHALHLYGLTVSESDGEICLKVDTSKGKDAHELRKMLYAWKEQADKLSSEEISKDKYDEWRYHYPEFDTTQTWAKVPSQALSDALVEMFQDKLKPDK